MPKKLLIAALLCNIFCNPSHLYASSTEIPILGKTMTQAKQQQMTPKQALQRLKDGNQRFLSNTTFSTRLSKTSQTISLWPISFCGHLELYGLAQCS